MTWLEPDELYEGVGAHRDNPRYDHATALADWADLNQEAKPTDVEEQ